jgi:hypothetical protein
VTPPTAVSTPPATHVAPATWFAQRENRRVTFAIALVLCVLTYFVADALYGLTFAILGRDHGIFQYTAWAMSHGEVLYRDIREINGPLPHLIHQLMQALGGSDERIFRCLDLTATTSVYAYFGYRLGLACGARTSRARTAVLLITLLVLTSQYVQYGLWHTAQRDHHGTLLSIAGIGLLLRSRESSIPLSFERADSLNLYVWPSLAGVLLTLPAFGKPTFALFPLLTLVCSWRDWKGATESTSRFSHRARRAVAFAAGMVVATTAMLGFVAWKADLRGYVQYVFVETTYFHRYFWMRTLLECYAAWGNAERITVALLFALMGLCGLTCSSIRRRFPLVVLVPFVGGTVSYLVQQKGFPYHLHPVSLGARAVLLTALFTYIFAPADQPQSTGPRLLASVGDWATARRLRAWGVAASCALCLFAFRDAVVCDARDRAWRASSENARLTRFMKGDYFPAELAHAAEFLRNHTRPWDRVQVYGFDPYVLFRAKRLSATPFLYNFDLTAPTVLGDARVPRANKEWIEEYVHENVARLHAQVTKQPPAAWVFIDHAPFHYPESAIADFEACCATTAKFVQINYTERGRFGHVHVYLNNNTSF